MNFKRYGVSKNVLPTSSEQVVENNGITYRSDGQGRYYITGTATSYSSAHFDITNFTIPISVGRGGSGTFSMFNLGTTTTNAAVIFMKNYTLIDEWNFSTNNRTNTTYSVMGDKEINQISLRVSSGTTVDIVVSPMFTNDGQLPSEFEPHMVWHDIPYYQHKTATDTLTLPAVLYLNDTTATVGLKGQMEQSGTPTPTTPIQPSECGDKTANLCSNIPYKRNYYINENGVETSYNGFDIYKVSAIAGTTYTLSLNTSLSGSQVRIHSYSNGSWIEQTAIVNAQSLPATFTTPNNCDEIRFSINYVALDHIMLNTGSQPLPYEPYGYKIPILLNSQTINKYLGEVQTTRKIKKVVLDGTESIQTVAESTSEAGTYVFGYRYDAIGMEDIIDYNKSMQVIPYPQFICSHFKEKTEGTSWSEIKNGECGANSKTGGNNIFFILASNQYSTGDAFKAYLAQQYTNGTPVCVWYVLAEPTTGIVNEPLMKIGTYADSLTTTIPVTAGENTLDVQTTVQPSEVTAEFSGWHPVQSVHEYEIGENIFPQNSVTIGLGSGYSEVVIWQPQANYTLSFEYSSDYSGDVLILIFDYNDAQYSKIFTPSSSGNTIDISGISIKKMRFYSTNTYSTSTNYSARYSNINLKSNEWNP